MGNSQVDIVILTVIPEELAAAKTALGIQDVAERRIKMPNSQTIYLSGELFSKQNQRNYRIALGCIGRAGNYDASTAATEVIEVCNPKLVVLVGIAAGIKGKAKLGEVVFSEQVVGYEPAALRQLEDGSQVVQPRPAMPAVPNSIYQNVIFYLASYKDQSLSHQQRLVSSFQNAGGRFPTLSVEDQAYLQKGNIVDGIEIDVCTIASGEKLLKDPSVLEDIRDRQHGRVKVGEMEAIGFAQACQRMQRDWLVIRGVSDFGDAYKSDVFHPLAAYAAATVLADFLQYGLDLGTVPLHQEAVHELVLPIKRTRQRFDWEVSDTVDRIIQEHEFFVSRPEQDQIDRFLSEHRSGLLLIKAGAGFGKTALLANWILKQQDNHYFIVRHFFNQRYKTHSLAKAYQYLLGQLCEYLEYCPESAPNTEEALREEIYCLLRDKVAKTDQPLVIVLDALDEAENILQPFFQKSLPENIFVVVSARADEEESPEYLSNWIERASEVADLKRLPCESIVEWLKRTNNDQLVAFSEDKHFINRINEITEGFPLYLNYLIEQLKHTAEQGQDMQSLLKQMPVGFEKYVKQQLKHLDNLDLSDQIRKFFALLTVAKGALAKEDIKVITGMCDRDLRQLQQHWQVIRWVRIRQEKFYAFTHPLLGTAFAQQLGDEANDALDDLIAHSLQWKEHQSPYALQHCIDHLRDSEQWRELSKLAGNSEFIRATLNYAFGTGDATTISEILLKNAHLIASISEQKFPLELLRTGSLDEALSLLELYESQPEIYTLWHLLLAWETKATGQRKEVSRIFQQLLKKSLIRFGRAGIKGWQNSMNAHLLANIFEPDLENFFELSRCILNEDDLARMCMLICKRGYYIEAFEIKRLQIERKLINKSFNNFFEIDQIQRIVEIQAENVGREIALKSCSKIAELLLIPGWELYFAREWAKLATLQVSLEEREAGRNYFDKAVDIAIGTQHQGRKAQDFLSIIYYQKEVGKNNSVFLEDALELLQSNNLEALDTSGLCSKVRFSIEIAEIQALLSRQKEARETLKKIEVYTERIEDFTEKIRCFIEIGKAYLKIGELAHAFQIADQKLRNSFSSHERSEFLIDVAQGYFKVGNINSAWQTISLPEEQRDKDDILSRLASKRANQLDFDNAFEIIGQIQDKYQQESALANVTRVQIQKHSQDEIEEQNISNNIEKISSQSEQSKLWLALAEQQLYGKKIAAAQKTVNRIQDQEEQRYIPKLFAIAYAKAGNFEQAIKSVNQIDNSKIRAETLQTIALIQIESGNHEAARSTLASLFTVQQGPELQTLKTCTLSDIADIQIKLHITQEASTTVELTERHLQQIKNRFVQAQLLADFARQWWKLGNIQKSQNSLHRALSIAQEIREEQEKKGVWSVRSECSHLFAIVAETQAKIGDFDAALETVKEVIYDSALKANVLRTIAQELSKSERESSYREKLKTLLDTTCEEIQANPFSSILDDLIQVFSTLAITEFFVGDQQAALETLSCLRKQAQGKDIAQILANIAIAEIEIKGIDAAIETAKDIDDPSQYLQVLWSVAQTQFNRGLKIELLATLDNAHEKYDQIKNEKQRLSAMRQIAGIQMMAGLGEQAIQTLERIPENRESMLSTFAWIAADGGDLKTFNQLLVRCAYHIDIAYEVCSCLAKLYPQKAVEIARAVDKNY